MGNKKQSEFYAVFNLDMDSSYNDFLKMALPEAICDYFELTGYKAIKLMLRDTLDKLGYKGTLKPLDVNEDIVFRLITVIYKVENPLSSDNFDSPISIGRIKKSGFTKHLKSLAS